LLLAVAALLSPIHSTAHAREGTRGRHWKAPTSCLFTKNPIRPSQVSIAHGKEIYQIRCSGCHGTAGHGDGPDASQLRVRPARLSSNRVQEQSDGALWWKITFGKSPMPGFGFRLSSADRWNVINYLRTLAEQEGPALGRHASEQRRQ